LFFFAKVPLTPVLVLSFRFFKTLSLSPSGLWRPRGKSWELMDGLCPFVVDLDRTRVFSFAPGPSILDFLFFPPADITIFLGFPRESDFHVFYSGGGIAFPIHH